MQITLWNLYNSAYKSYHSTETALLKVKADILKVMDNQEVTCLVLPDLSAAFDTVDNKILLERLENYFGINSIALQWIELYLTNPISESCNWGYKHDRCQVREHQFKVWYATGQCLGPNSIYSIHVHLVKYVPIRFSTIFMQMTSRSTSVSNQDRWVHS